MVNTPDHGNWGVFYFRSLKILRDFHLEILSIMKILLLKPEVHRIIYISNLVLGFVMYSDALHIWVLGERLFNCKG